MASSPDPGSQCRSGQRWAGQAGRKEQPCVFLLLPSPVLTCQPGTERESPGAAEAARGLWGQLVHCISPYTQRYLVFPSFPVLTVSPSLLLHCRHWHTSVGLSPSQHSHGAEALAAEHPSAHQHRPEKPQKHSSAWHPGFTQPLQETLTLLMHAVKIYLQQLQFGCLLPSLPS